MYKKLLVFFKDQKYLSSLGEKTIFAVVYMFFALAAFAVGKFWWSHIKINSTGVAPFAEFEQFGDNCEAGIGDWSNSFEESYKLNIPFQKVKMPYRGTGFEPKLTEAQYLHVKCIVDFSQLQKSDYAGVFLGFVGGKSAIFIDKELRLLTDESSYVNFPLSLKDRKAGTEISIISKKSEKTAFISLASLVPLMKITSDLDLIKIRHIFTLIDIEQRAFRIAWASALVLIFAVSWYFGIKYTDNTWMIILGLCFVFESFAEYKIGSQFYPWKNAAEVFYRNTIAVAFGGFLIAFLRIDFLRSKIITIYLGLMFCLGVVVLFLQNTALYNIARFDLPLWLTVVAFLVTAVIATFRFKSIPDNLKKRNLIIISMCYLGAITYAVNIVLIAKTGIYLHPFINFGFLTIFACFLGVDLVVYHKNFLEEKNRRLIEENQRIQIEEKLKLGKAVQDLLLPEEREGETSNGYKFFLEYRPSYQMAGDWIFHWKNETSERFYFGDVVGKGPSAALATSCICTTLTTCLNDNKSIDESILAINEALLTVFKGKLGSTLSAIEILENGRARLFNHGNVGWFLKSESKCNFINIVSDSLGRKPEIIINSKEVILNPTDSIISMTDGILEGSRALKAFVRAMEKNTNEIFSLRDILKTAEEIGKDHVLDDDQTFIAISRI